MKREHTSKKTQGLTPQLVAEALKRPGGWVYEIVGEFSAEDPVPPEAIRGAWAVDERGQIVGEFIANPNFQRAP